MLLFLIGIIIGFELPEYNVDEPDGEVTIAVIVVGGILRRPAEVTFFTTDGTATTTGEPDFQQLGDVVLQFDENIMRREIRIGIIDDSILEDNEFFFGNLSTTDDAVDLMPDNTLVNILEVGDGKLGWAPL